MIPESSRLTWRIPRAKSFKQITQFEDYSIIIDVHYTCDKQVLWESAVAFFSCASTLISRDKSHISRARGLVVRCLFFNPEVSCSNPWVCAHFLYKYSKAEGSHFFGHYEIFRLCATFSKFLKCPQRVLLSFF